MIYNAYAEGGGPFWGMQLVSCGHIFAKPGREICRPEGREDWLLFYIVKESESFYLDQLRTGTPGSFILYGPGEKQHHKYTGSKTAEFYYVHFRCSELPLGSLTTSRLYNAPLSRQVCDLFSQIIEETMRKQPLYERLCISKLWSIFTLLERGILWANHPDKENYQRIARAVQHMNQEFSSSDTLEDYARLCAMSKYHFLRLFEKLIGCTPMEYRNNIRLQHAADLLLEKNLSVEQIGNMVGYSSASYFSSAFKQRYGLSPKQYQVRSGK